MLPNKKEGHDYLDPSLRLELLKYGELTQLTYDGFESRELNRRSGVTYHNPDEFMGKVEGWVSEATRKYQLVRSRTNPTADGEENFMFANVTVFDPRGEFSKLDFIPPVRWIKRTPPVRLLLGGARRVYRVFRPPPNVTQIELDFNYGLSFTRDKGSAWIGYIAVDKEAGDVVVAFRGTILPDEWKANIMGNILKAPHKKYVEGLSEDLKLPPEWEGPLKEVRVHDGFLKLFHSKAHRNGAKPLSPRQQMQDRLRDLVNHEMKGQVKTITFVGHSLGGALATIAAGYLALARGIMPWAQGEDWQRIKIRAYTFSAPRVGGPRFREELERRGVMVLNTVNAWDVVPVVPGVFNALVDSLIRTGRRTPVTGNSFALPNLSRVLRRIPIAGPLLLRLVPWNYKNSGLQLAFSSGRADKAMRRLGWDPRTWFDVGPKHNLEGLLYMVAKQYTHPQHSPEVFRDIALMNKSDRLLKKEVMEALDIPACWWEPQKHKGMHPATVTPQHGKKQVIFRDTKPLPKP